MKQGRPIIAALLAMAAGNFTFAQAQPTSQASGETQCQSLLSADFSNLPEAPTLLTAADGVAAAADFPAFCRVQGYIAPNVGFELRMPIEKWNGKFIEVGCGGFCGILDGAAGGCLDPLRRGYACIATDMGHKGNGRDMVWAYDNLQAEIDFGFRSTHVTLLAGRAIAERFYSKGPHKSYFIGCSTGGRQGMMEAQKYPWDFDGIIAGAPAEPTGSLRQVWMTALATDKDGKPILGETDLQLLHRAVLQECDQDDGVRDGLIGSPLSCRSRFDPSRLSCKAAKNASCLTAEQTSAIKKIYDGPKSARGADLYLGGYLPGVELDWLRMVIPEKKTWFGGDVFRYIAFLPDPGPGWSVPDFDFESYYQRMQTMQVLYGARDPDLRKFKAAGGRLIAYHGWDDTGVVPINTVDYYETVQRTMGGSQPTEEFFRLFMIPGMGHCWDGKGAYAVDYLSALEAWVEEGRPPQSLIGTHPKDEYKVDLRDGRLTLPLKTEAVQFTRPHFPYPATARYRGKGDPNDASNFVAVKR